MKPARIVTHLLALAAGYGFGSIFLPGKAPDATEAGRPESPDHSKTSTPRIQPRELLTALTSVPMSAADRQSLKSSIYAQWTRSNPEGLLSYLQGKAWPGYMMSEAFSVLAENDPQGLLRYIRENGCPDALSKLTYEGDPRARLSLLLGEGSHSYPDSVFETLFERGEDLDPDFHRRISELPDDRAKKAAFDKIGEVMIKAKRYDEYFEFLGKYGRYGSGKAIAGVFAAIVLDDHKRLDQLDEIPEPFRDAAIKSVIAGGPNIIRDEQATRDLLPLLAERNLLERHREDVIELILNSALDEGGMSGTSQGESWKNWALGLQEGQRWDLLRHAAIARWVAEDPRNLETIESLPTPKLQDAARIGAIISLMQNEQLDEAKQITAGIRNAASREKISRAIKQTEAGEEVENFDPFPAAQ